MTSGPRATYPTERSPQNRRRWFLAASTAVVIMGVALAVIGYLKYSDTDVKGEATGYEIIDSHTVAVQFTVTRSDPSQPAACVVRGRSLDGGETGRREILIPPSKNTQIGVKTTVQTSQPPVIGEVFGCSTTIPAYLKADKQ
ncbi:DUF4307 domain-containing protein [Gordonia pseudamarae]|uniref:DUF4307 domain-containing protein n=1 Tax=Gordonia pseudamarae TaxID=2831662 RepID=A0ABX6IFL3_9ACTN|nr:MULTISPECIES: DUF4307 domain-containing protein [Gordonia]MBD0020488.1 DUF4307 domain-containing protein [Gordonia sp. (in: high G+C Gram-positive bacteria)]QHN25666.1 DUF4307 domain-containing protein [Gordonia pseudamarae]QHN34598.1 DUF4307 domain-containing protein [Gordonia pseudamarae]